tara:strand:- start:344 stop:451 length:108 start_codon:yes stop_codon:yes gene_type:complete
VVLQVIHLVVVLVVLEVVINVQQQQVAQPLVEQVI